jgi:GAF domain-containing protein
VDTGEVLTLAPDAAVVPHARHFAARALAGAAPSVVDDARVVVTELVTNAILHGAGQVTVAVLPDGAGGARIEVGDRSPALPVVPAIAVDPAAVMTGRGLNLVTALAYDWGVEPNADGKVVWAELRDGAGGPVEHAAAERRGDTARPAALEPGEFAIDLGDVPTDLAVAAKLHIDNVIREVTLAGAGEGESLPPALLTFVDVARRFSARAQLKELASRAAARGEPSTHLTLRLRADAIEAGERYLAGLEAADQYARSARMLTLETPPVEQVLRRWYTETVVDQLRHLSAGEPPPPKQTFVERLQAEYTDVAPLRHIAARMTLLQHATARLASASTVEEVAHAVVEEACHTLGAEVAVVYRLDPDGMLRDLYRAGIADVELARSYESYPLDADLPGSVALRTGQSLVFRSRAEMVARFPQLAGASPNESVLLVTPLIAAGRPLGVLAMQFADPSLVDHDFQQALIGTLGGVTAQAWQRAAATATADQAVETLRFLAEASVVLSSSVDYRTVLRAVADLVVPRLADWCAIQLLDAGRLETVALTHVDPAMVEAARDYQARFPTDMTAPTGAPNVVRTGESELYGQIPSELLTAPPLSPEARLLIEQLGLSSALIVPLTGRSGIIGALTSRTGIPDATTTRATCWSPRTSPAAQRSRSRPRTRSSSSPAGWPTSPGSPRSRSGRSSPNRLLRSARSRSPRAT